MRPAQPVGTGIFADRDTRTTGQKISRALKLPGIGTQIRILAESRFPGDPDALQRFGVIDAICTKPFTDGETH